MHVDAVNTGSATAKCREIDRMARKFIEKVRDSLSQGLKRLGDANVTAMIDDFSIRVNEIAARSKQHILLQAMDRKRPLNDQSGAVNSNASAAMGDSMFWKERQAEFANYADSLAKLHAFWRADFGIWFLWWGTEQRGIAVPEEHKRTFDAIARNVITKLPLSPALQSTEPWQRWLDFMRQNGWGYRVTGHVPCTEREWDLGVKDGKPLAQVRKEQGYTTGDEWTKVYMRTKSGELRLVPAKELEGKSSEELHKYYHWLEHGSIENVFQASVSFCEELASRVFQIEANEKKRKEIDSNSSHPSSFVSSNGPASKDLESERAIDPSSRSTLKRGKHPNTVGPDKWNVDLLQGPDGKRKTLVNLDVAARFGGVSKRAIEKAIQKGRLISRGQSVNRRVLVTSLLEYFPPEK